MLPGRFQLVAATNPCPCGGGPPGWCECDDVARLRYLRRLSGPLLDRFDLRVAVQRPSVDDMLQPAGGEATATVAARVAAARRIALDRPGGLNAGLHGELLDDHAAAHRRGARRCCARRWSVVGSPDAATTGSAASPAPSPICTAARTGHVAEQLDVEPVEVALSMRTRLRAASVGVVA